MLTRTSYKSTFFPSSCQGGVSNGFIISNLVFEMFTIPPAVPFGVTGGIVNIHPEANK